MNHTLLNKLYTTFSPSKAESKMVKLVCTELDAIGVDYDVDALGQIYAINDGMPLICAHMDQVQSTACAKIIYVKNMIYGFSERGKLSGLGADDKNGVFIALAMIRKFKTKLSFIFTVQEECGGQLDTLLPILDLDTTKAPYGLIFDRRGSGDIIGVDNEYCCKDLEDAIHELGKPLGYKPCDGVFSDCDSLSDVIPCVNLSCGYYSAHSEKEHTSIPDLFNALKLAKKLIENLPTEDEPFGVPEKRSWFGNYGAWKNTEYDKWLREYSRPTKRNPSPALVKNGTSYYDNLILLVDDDELEIEHTVSGANQILNCDVSTILDMDINLNKFGSLKIEQDRFGMLSATLDDVPIAVEDYRTHWEDSWTTDPDLEMEDA